MPASRSCSCCNTMVALARFNGVRSAGSVLHDRDRRAFDTELAQQAVGAWTGGLEPDLIQPPDVGLRVAPGRIADLAERIHQRQELGCKLREHTANHPPA